MLHEISAGGVAAYCSDLMVDPEDTEQVYFLSVAGYQTAVKGILANFLEHNRLNLMIEGRIHYIQRYFESYFLKVKKLPSGYSHGLAFLKTVRPEQMEDNSDHEFMVISNQPDQIKSLFYKHLQARTEIPLHPSWAEWLWRLHEAKEWLVKLQTLIGSYQGYLVCLEPEELQAEIAQAIRSKVPELVGCLTRKGVRSHGQPS